MSKGKAQAFEEDSNASASDLAADEKTGDASIIGYELKKVDGEEILKFVTLEDFTGEETLLPVNYDFESLRELERIVELNKKSLRKRNRFSASVFSAIGALGGVTLLSSFLMVVVLDLFSTTVASTTAATVSMLTSILSFVGISVWERCKLRILPKIFPVHNVDSMRIEGELKAEQGFTSLISNNRFKIGSPSHETFREAVKLLNTAWAINDNLKTLESRQNTLEYKRKNSAQRREMDELKEQIRELESKLQDTENEIEALLLRNDD